MSIRKMSQRIRSDRGEVSPVAIFWIVLVALIVTPIVAYFISVAVSGPKGHLDAVKQKNEANNQIFSQETFQAEINAIVADVKNVKLLYGAWQADPTSVTARKDYVGTVQVCNDDVAQYNADAKKFTLRDFRDADLPMEIDTSDPKYDCNQFGASVTASATPTR